MHQGIATIDFVEGVRSEIERFLAEDPSYTVETGDFFLLPEGSGHVEEIHPGGFITMTMSVAAFPFVAVIEFPAYPVLR